MAMSISNHRLQIDGQPALFKQTPNRGGPFQAEGIVLHDTAGQLTKYSSVNWFLDPKAKASAHFVVERDGEITQMSALNTRCWHAGESIYNARKDVNDFAFGIEIVNLGLLEKTASGAYRAWFKKEYTESSELKFFQKTTPEHGAGHWLDYTEEQIASVTELCQTLKAKYDLEWITTHWFISPKRKVDTNPLFPLEQVRNAVLGSQDSAPALMLTTIASINHRRWPSYQDNVIQIIPKGANVTALRRGVFTNDGKEESWILVSYGDHEGWINSVYV